MISKKKKRSLIFFLTIWWSSSIADIHFAALKRHMTCLYPSDRPTQNLFFVIIIILIFISYIIETYLYTYTLVLNFCKWKFTHMCSVSNKGPLPMRMLYACAICMRKVHKRNRTFSRIFSNSVHQSLYETM